MSSIKDSMKDAGQKVMDTARDAAHFIADKAGKAAEWVKDKTEPGSTKCGDAKTFSDIQPQMDVISSCGCNMGKVDHLEADSIKLTKNDSTDGKHHYVPKGWVARVDEHVHLSRNAEETIRMWHDEAAAATAG
jgi:hypothetical protein